VRQEVGIADGILTGAVKNRSVPDNVVDFYFQHNQSDNQTCEEVYSCTLDSFKKIATASTKNKELTNYASSITDYFKQDIICYSFKKLFKEKVEEAEMEEEKAKLKRRDEEEKEKLMHQGRINGYLASQKGSLDIQADLQSDSNTLKRPNDDDYGDDSSADENKAKRVKIAAEVDKNGTYDYTCLHIVYIFNLLLINKSILFPVYRWHLRNEPSK
jgi:hypothetical protein